MSVSIFCAAGEATSYVNMERYGDDEKDEEREKERIM